MANSQKPVRTVMKKKAITCLRKQVQGVGTKGCFSGKLRARVLEDEQKKALQKVQHKSASSKEKAKAAASKGLVKKGVSMKQVVKLKAMKKKEKKQEKTAALKKKLEGRALAAAAKRKAHEDFLEARRREEALLTPEELKEKRRYEGLVTRDYPAVLKKIVEFEEKEAKQRGEVLQESSAFDALDKAVEVATKIFKEVWLEYVLECDRGHADGEERENRAAAYMEKVAAQRYDELRAVMADLVPWMGSMLPEKEELGYTVFERNGHAPPEHIEKGGFHWRLLGAKCVQGLPGLERVMGAQLACARRYPQFRALEAFSMMMSIVSARKEKSFLEAFDTRTDLENEMRRLKKKGMRVMTKGSPTRNDAIRVWLAEQAEFGYGYFSHYLVKPHAKIRIAFAPDKPMPMPVAFIATEHICLWDCLGNPDNGDGCFLGDSKSWDWWNQEGTELAFQEANLEEEDLKSVNSRMLVKDLKPDPALRELLLSKKPLVYLEVTAALAPRDLSKAEGHSKIIIAELAKLMRDAKSRGEAVVMAMGSDEPHKLAQKVYLRNPIGECGLKCGYFRWRGAANAPWAAEIAFTDRPCHCIQMP